ncbi:universal stress protein [Thioclava sp. GXIMD4216]|uniref:Universal stress protein n=1 Tax=Thioclava litoralis TaxID=3076557 RepID=A0ABZ1DXX3_9RHOB|nr:universal stress protein [Thioclava sp. FTW29]
MDKKIISFVDGSHYSASVCDYTAWAMARLGVPAELIHVLGRAPEQSEDLSGTIALGARSALMAQLASIDEQRAKLVSQRGRAILEDAKARTQEVCLRDGCAQDVATQLRNGDILEAVTEREADARLIIIGKRGDEADIAHDHLGSNLERAIRSTKVPVLVANRAFAPVERVAIAYDGGVSAKRAMAVLAQSPIFTDLDLQVVSVGDNARSRAEEGCQLLAQSGLQPRAVGLSGEPEKALGSHIDADGIDLIVMGAYGHSRIRSFIIGSTTTALIRACKVPVLLMR